MSSLGILQPQLNDSFDFYYKSDLSTLTFTVAQLLDKIQALGDFDSFILVSSTGGTSPNNWAGLFYVHPFKIGTVENCYIADGEYLGLSGTNQQNNVGIAIDGWSRTRYYFDNSGNLVARGNSSAASATVNDILYNYDALIGTSLETPCYNVIYVGGNVTNLYKNYIPSVTSILDYQAQIPMYHRRFVTENSILYNNTNSNKYVTYTYSGTTYKIYNSAIYYDQTNNAVYFMLLLNDYGEMLSQYENGPNDWRTGSRSYLHNSMNSVYYGNFSYNNAGFIYYNGVSSSTLDHINDYGLPFFTDKDKYMDYICSVYVPVTVRVSYVIPNDDYKYCKLTWKKDEMPTSVNDGTSATILKDEPTVDVIGLEEGADYWFTIYTNKSESPPFPFTVPINPIPPQYRTFIDNINGSGFDWIRAIQQDTATITNSDHSTFTSNMYKYYPMNKVTWYTYNKNGTDVANWNKNSFKDITTALFVNTTIDKVEINSNNGSYSCTIKKNNNDTTDVKYMFVYDKTITMGGIYTDATLPRKLCGNFNNHSDYLAYGPNCNPWYNGSWSTKTFSGTLTEVFTQLQRYVRNIDIYVDGELWSKGGK